MQVYFFQITIWSTIHDAFSFQCYNATLFTFFPLSVWVAFQCLWHFSPFISYMYICFILLFITWVLTVQDTFYFFFWVGEAGAGGKGIHFPINTFNCSSYYTWLLATRLTVDTALHYSPSTLFRVIFGYLYYANKHTGKVKQPNTSCELIKKKTRRASTQLTHIQIGRISCTFIVFW